MKNETFLRRTDSGKNPVTSSNLGTKLWLSCFLSLLVALVTSDSDLGLLRREKCGEDENEEEK